MKKDWRLLVFSDGNGGSIYQADVYCAGCTEKIKKELRSKTPEDLDDESSFDSDDYPKVADLEKEESDSPQHCGSHERCVNAIKLPCGSKIGAWLGGSLTGEGIEMVCDSIWTDLVSTSDHARQVGRLWRHLYSDQISEFKGEPKEADKRGLKISLLGELHGFKPLQSLVDLDAVYVVGEQKDKVSSSGGKIVEWREKVRVLRYEADPLGNFPKKPEDALTDPEIWEKTDVEDVLKDVIEEEGW